MNFVQSVLDSGHVQRLGWTLLHSLWEAAAVAAALVVVLRLMRGAAARVRYLASCAAMLAVLALPAVTFLLLRPAPTAPPSRALLAATGSLAPAESKVTVVGAGDTPGPVPLVIAAPRWVAGHSPAAPTAPAAARPLVSSGIEGLRRAMPWLVLAWGCGVALLSLWNLGGWVAIQRLKVVSIRPVDSEICQTAERLCRRLGVNRTVRLLKSARVVTPMVVGALKPVILLPASVLCELSAAQLESLLAHELAHVRRHDYLANLFQSVVETLMFYHPAVWWIGHRIRVERENCCDDVAVSLTRDRVTYARALALVAAGAPALALAASGGVLVARVRRILGLPERDVVGAPRWLSGALVVAVVLTVAAMMRPHEPTARAAPAGAPQTQPSSMQVTILDAETGQPVPGVSIRPYIHGTNDPRATTDANGRADLPLPPDTRSMNLWARGEGYVPTVARLSKDKGAALPLEFTMRIERGATVGGTVVDERGNPIGGVAVFVQADVGSYDASRVVSTQVYDDKFVTDPQGKWRCGIIPKGAKQVSLRLEHPDYASDARYGDSGNPSLDELLKMSDVLVLKKGFAVSGRVVDADGKPIDDATVALGQRARGGHAPTARTDASGRFVLPHCQGNEQVQMAVTAKGHSPAVEQFPLRADRRDFDVRLKGAKPLIVRVVNPQGKPLPDSRLFIQQWRNGNLIDWDAHTDAQGRAVWNEAPETRSITASITRGTFSSSRRRSLPRGRNKRLRLFPR